MIKFTTAYDPDYGWMVIDAAIRAKSFALVPMTAQWAFRSRREAQEQARRLTALGNVATRSVETPERFEAVADTLYGPAW